MGRLDLTAEVGNISTNRADNRSELKNIHGLKVFLKVKASPKTSLFGEFLNKESNQAFFYVDYAGSDAYTVSFGKILVPFGDTRYFHHFYGGIQGIGANGILLQNIWAEPGANVQFHDADWVVDAYVVNGIKAADKASFPDLTQTANEQRQAFGSRVQWQGLSHITMIGSAYFDYYWDTRPLSLLGGDIYTDYGLWSWPVRVGVGIANATASDIPDKGNLQRRADYLMVAANGLGPGEVRLRYGTYNHIVDEKSKKDTHSFDLAYSFNVDVIRLMIERQWNFEAQNEEKNDLLRFMASIDF
jgi:hypothetical protein